MTLRLVPHDGGDSGPEKQPPESPSHQAVTDGEALENRVTLQRLADNLLFLGPPGAWPEDMEPGPGQLVVVFDADALPELASLLYRRRP